MAIAYSFIRKQPFYRADAFKAGLQAVGYQVIEGSPKWPINPGDALCIWNRYFDTEAIADRFEEQGGTVFCAENGYLGQGGTNPKFDVAKAVHEGSYYALAIHAHNGAGTTPEGSKERFDKLGVALKPWRETGDHVLVLPNRSFGMRGFIMPNDWAEATARELKSTTARPVRIRPHPGNDKPARPLEADLENCWACVIWSSSAGVQALVNGIPVICLAPWWICKTAALDDITRIEDWIDPRILDGFRKSAFHKLASAQYTVREIRSGEAFSRCLSNSRQEKSAVAV